MFHVVYRPAAVKALDKIPLSWRRRIVRAIDGLKENPYSGKKLQGKLSGAFSLRVWPYRIIYCIDKIKITIIILEIGHRQEVYN
jgi:mRNA interferase RelE/StbE